MRLLSRPFYEAEAKSDSSRTGRVRRGSVQPMPEAAVADLETLVAAAERRYVERNPESRRLHQKRAKVMPGGNTRTIIHVEPFPLTIVRGDGAHLTDADGHEYVDLLGEFTAGLFGHSQPAIVQAIRDALADGVSFGSPNRCGGGCAAALRARLR